MQSNKPRTNKGELLFAQKGLILNQKLDSILTARYEHSKYFPQKLNGKLFLPGGKMNYGEMPENSFIAEIKEETGITVKAMHPFYIWTWFYDKKLYKKQIVAVARIGIYQSGELHKGIIKQSELLISDPFWLQIKKIKVDDFVEDERPAIKNFLKYQEVNPFKLKAL